MSLEGAKLVCLDEAGNHGQIVLAKGRKFTMGYYVSCDFVLVDERAKGVHCEIECDAFGRVTIRNLSPENPIFVNGSSVEIKRILLNNSKLSILDKEYLWLFPKNSSSEFEDITTEATSTPQKTSGIPEQPPNSCPDFKLHRDLPKRFTVHNFAYCIQSDEEGNISSQSNNEDTETNQTQNENESDQNVKTQQIVNDESSENTSQVKHFDELKEERERSITPEPNKEMPKLTTELTETPKLDLINCTNDKENKSTQKKSKQLLTMCHHSDLVITSFSPRETGVKIEKSFVTIVKPKVQVTKSALTPKSVYSTPKSDLTTENDDDHCYENEGELTFHTPSTSKKPTSVPTKVLTNSSMHIIDLTTPYKKRAVSPYLKSALKTSAKKNISTALEKPRTKLAFDEHQSHLSAQATTPVTIDGTTTTLSVISLNSSTDNSSVIEELSDRSNMAVTGSNTPLKTKNHAVASCTPKRTPQSLMKRAILTSAKKQINTQNPALTRRESINRIPLRNRLPVTPQASIGNSSLSQLPRRQSMSTPTRKSVTSANRFFDNSPSTSKLISGSPTLMSSSKSGSSLNLITAAKALSTSTPMSGSTNNSSLRSRRTACKTSPLHKVRKSFGNVALSSHISKVTTSATASKLTSIKNKPPQQIMSDRLITKARKSWCFTPISSRSRDMVANAITPSQKTGPSNIQKNETATQSVKKPDRQPVVLFTDNNPLDTSNEDQDDLSRTFIIDSDTEENADSKEQHKNPMNITFSPEKISSEIEKPIKEQQTIDTPLDVEEVIDLAKENNEQSQCENKNEINQTTNEIQEEEERECYITESPESPVNNKENNSLVSGSDPIKSVVTEESFAEIINDFKEPNNLPAIFEISDSQGESLQNKTQEDLVKTSNQNVDKTVDVADVGFGEESTENRDEKVEAANKIENGNKSKMREEKQQAGDDINTQTIETKSLDVEEVNSKVDLLKCNESKSYEYKPIVEDITLEDSAIEKETKENDKMSCSKQPLYEDITLENSLIEEKVKSEEIKEEIKENITKENTEKLSSTNTNVCDNLKPTEGEISSNNIPKELIMFDQSENIEEAQITKNELESLETKQIDKNKNVNPENENASDEVAEQATQRIENSEASRAEDQSSTMVANRVDDDNEDTNKLLEEIEDVLNKSDEIKQKQNLNETENDSETPPINESEKLLSQTSEMVENTTSIDNKKNLKLFNDQQNSNDEDLQQSSSSVKTSAQIMEAKSESEVTTQKENIENSAEIVIVTKSTEENCKEKSLITETSVEREDHSKFCTSKLEEFTNNEEESEAKEPAKIIEIKRSEEELQETNISQSKNNNEEMSESSGQKNTETGEAKNVIEIDQNIEQQNEEETAILVTSERAEQNVQENVCSENISKPGEKIQTDERSEEPAAAVDFLLYQNPNKSFENTSIENNSNETMKDNVKESNLNKTEILQNIESTEELNTIKAKMENAISFTPRRSTRRASQSTDTPQASAELSFTPRRSTRRASISAESTTATCTPTRKTTRRASLSSVNETPLTPKAINKRRRSSFSADSEITQPSTSKTQRAKTPRKQFEQRLVIPEEIDEVINEVIMENEELPASEITKPSDIKTPQSINMREEETHEVVDFTLKRAIALENKISNIVLTEKISTEESTIGSLNEPKEIVEFSATKDDEILKIQGEIEKCEENQEVLTSNVVETTENQVTDDNETKEDTVISQEGQNTNKINIQTTDNSNSIEEDVKSNIAQDVTNDDLEDNSLKGFNVEANTMLPEDDAPQHTESNEKLNITADKTSESPKVTEIPDELLKTFSCSATPTEDKVRKDEAENRQTEEKSMEEMPMTSTSIEQKEISSSEIIDGSGEGDLVNALEERQGSGETEDMEKIASPKFETQRKMPTESPRTPVMTGVRELLKTPKVEAQTPRLGGIRDLVRTPKPGLENEDEEIEKLAVVADLTRTPATNLPNISTPKTKKHVTIKADSPKTPVMAGMRELLKTPKAEPKTPRLEGIRDLVRTPKPGLENEDEETEKLAVVAELIKTPVTNVAEISTPKTKKHVTIVADSPKTPVMTGVRELLKTPKKEMITPKLSGIRDLVRTPKFKLENEQEEIEKLAVVSELIKTPVENIPEEMPTSSMQSGNFKGVKELLKTPKSCTTPTLRVIRELMQTPKTTSTPITIGVKELLETPVSKEDLNLQTSTAEMNENPKRGRITNLKAVKMSSTPLVSDVKSFMHNPAEQNDQELEQFLKTPTAKNIMIPTMPSSAIMEKSGDSIEVSTEYDLNATNEAETPNLEELFKTPMSSRYVERITASYYGPDELEHDDQLHDTVQDTLNKSGEKAYDKLREQESQIHTPIRKRYTRQSFTLQTPNSQSPFTASDVLSDLPKTDVEEWVETLEQAEPSTILECDDGGEYVDEVNQQDHLINESEKDIQETSLNEENSKNQSFDESIIPETCTKVYITENTLTNKINATLTCTSTKDPLSHTMTKLNENKTDPLVTSVDAEISGIDLLDQTLDSVEEEEPSMFEEHLKVSDNESEAENALEISRDEGLSEPLLLSDSEDLNVSQETEANNKMLRTKNQGEIKQPEDQELPTLNLDINVQEKSMLEKLPNKIDPSLAQDPLETGEEETSVIEIKEENKSLVELDAANLADNNWTGEETVDENEESIYNIDMAQTCDIITHEQQQSFIETELPPTEIKDKQKLVLDEYLPKQLFATDENIENVKQETTEELEIFSTSQITDEVLQTPQTNETEKESDNNVEKNIINETLNVKEISIEQTSIRSTESENIFVDSTVNEICEETSVPNQEHVESKESVETKKDKQKSTNYECQNIFMENSNIDESFADEAANEENEDAVSVATMENVVDNEAQNVSQLTAENKNDRNDLEKEQNVSHTEQIEKEEEKDLVNEEVNEILEKSKITESSVTVEEAETDHAIVLEEESTESDQVTQSKLGNKNEDKITEETQELKQTNTITQYEMAEPSLQIKNQPIETSSLEVVSLDEKQIETKSSEIFLNKLENTEIQSSETLETKMESSLDRNEVTTKSSEPTEITEATAILTEYTTEYEEAIKPSTSSVVEPRDCTTQTIAETTKILSDTSQSVIEKFLNEDSVKSSVYELQQETIIETVETIEKVSNENLNDSSTELNSNDALTDKTASNPIEYSEELPVKLNEDKTAKDVEIEKENSLETGLIIETSEINIKEETVKSPNAITEAIDETSNNCEEIPQTLHETDDVLKETINDFEGNCNMDKDVISPSKNASPNSTKISLTQQQPESSTEEVKPIEKSSEVLIATSEVVKYNFEVKINDLDDPMEQIRKDIVSEESNTEMSECTKHLKTPVAKVEHCPQDEKEDYNETGQEIEINKTTIDAAKSSRRKMRTVSESSQDSTNGEEKSTSSRRDRRKITQKICEQTLVEENEEIPKDTISATDEKDEKQKRKRTTSDSSQGSVKDDENYAPTRRGGRKVKKVPTVAEQKEEGEEFLAQATVGKEQKTNEHIPTTVDKKRTQKVDETESNQELTCSKEAAEDQSVSKETSVEPLHGVEKTTDEDFNVKQNKETAQSVTEIQQQIRPEEKQPAVTEELHLDDQRSDSSIASVAQLASKTDSEQHLTATQDQVSLREKTISSVSNKKVEGEREGNKDFTEHSNEKEQQLASICADEVLTIPKESCTKAHTTEDKSEEGKVGEEIKSQDPATVSKVTKTTRTQSKIQKTPIEETAVVERLDNEKMSASSSTANEIHLGTEEISTEKGKEQPIDNEIVQDKNVTLEIQKETPNLLVRSKSKVTESKQAKVHEDDTTRPRRGRRAKVQKTPTEDIATEEKTCEPIFSTKTEEETKESSNEKTTNKIKSAADTNEGPKMNTRESEHGSVPDSIELTKTLMMENQTKEISKDHKESKDMVDKHGRNKQISQEIVLNEPTPTRKGRRKLQVSTAEVHLESEAKTAQVENEAETKEERLEILKEPLTETKANTKLTGRRGRHYKLEVKENAAEKDANEEDTTPSTSHANKLESVQTDLPLKETEVASNEKQNEKIQETPEVKSTQEETGNDKETLEQEASIKKPLKRGRPRKNVVGGNAKLQEEITTRGGGRHITSASETTTSTVDVLPKSRGSNRKNQTPTEHSRSSHQQELSEIIEKLQGEEIFDELPTDDKTTAVEIFNKTPAEQEISPEQQEQRSGKENPTIDSLEKVAKTKILNNRTEEDVSTPKGKVLSGVKTRVKRTRTGFATRQEDIDVNEKPANKRARHQINETAESHEEDSNIKSPQIQKTKNIQSHEEEDEIEKDFEEKQQKTTTRRKVTAAREERITHHKQLSIKSKGRRAVQEESETQRIQTENEESEKVYTESMELKKTTTDDVPLSKVHITEVNLEPEKSLDQKASAEEIQTGDKIKRGRRKANLEENLKEDQELLLATKRRGAAVKNINQDHNESSSSSKKRVGRKKQVKEEEEQENKTEVDLDDHFETNKKIKDDGHHNVIDKEEEEKHSENEIEESKHTENNEAIEDLKEPHEETKKGKSQRLKTNDQDKIEQAPETKRRGRKRKESHKETHDRTTKEQDQANENLTEEPETKTSSATEEEISKSAAPVARRGRKAIEHITAESQEFEDTPGKRARNVPQRRAATAYHNYDETSDTEVLIKAKKKTDSPRKSVEAVVNTPSTVIITSAAITTLSSSPVSSATQATTARGRTRKPNPKVQQFLEEQRAKAETPKKRGLLAAVAANETATPQGTPARRGRKPSTIETEIEGTPQASKAPRGRGKLAATAHITSDDHSNVPATVIVIEEKEIEAKGRRGGGRKAKITEEETNSSDEPPAKKSPSKLENEKQDNTTTTSTPFVEIATPTRTAGRRNAAAAAKARIEEDALAAADIEQPKRARARKAPIKFSTPQAATTDTEAAHTSEVDEEQTDKEEKVEKEKNASQLRTHRLASASTIEGVEDSEDDSKIETKLKPVGKRGRKVAAAATDSPAVPVKRGRKAKIVEEVTASETLVEPKTSRVRGRGRKNVHFDEHNEAEASSSTQKTTNDNELSPVAASTSEPTKKVTRTRRK